jgi:hypothetical protein
MRRRYFNTTLLLTVAVCSALVRGSGSAQDTGAGKRGRPQSAADRCLEQNSKPGGNPSLPCVEINSPTGQPPRQPPPAPEPPRQEPPAAGNPNEQRRVHTLDSYQSGRFLRPGLMSFCRALSQEISGLSSAGHKVRVIVTGHADGEVNPGVSKEHERPTAKCSQVAQGETINDTELARLRGCIVWDLLTVMLDEQGIVLFGGDTRGPEDIKVEDIADGGDSGNLYRKVVVEVFSE